MKKDLLDILRCPECKGELDLEILALSEDDKETDEIESGELECKNCDITYPIEDGIPDMIPPEE